MMKIKVMVFLLLSVTLPSAAGAAPAPTVIIGGKPVAFVVAPFIGAEDRLYAPVNAVLLLGASFQPSRRAATILVTGSAGQSVSVPYTLVQGRYCVPLQVVALGLGADADWQPATQTLTIRAKLQMVRQNDNGLTIYTSYPVYYAVQHLDQPERIYVDLFGLALDTAPASVPVTEDAISQIRSGQINFNTVRIALDLRRPLPFHVTSGIQTNQVQIALGSGKGVSAEQASARLAPMPVTPLAAGVRITSVSLRSVSESLSQLVIQTTGPAAYRTERLDNPSRLAFDLTGATLDPAVSPIAPGDGALIKSVRSGILRAAKSGFGRIVLDMAASVGYSVTSQPGEGGAMTYLVTLQSPPRASQSSGLATLAGKVVVVDPGHGAQDSGAVGLGGVCEKNLTLAIGLRLRDTLTQNGATVFMTREDDSFLPVTARPRLAVARQADYFISIHCDSSGGANSHSGTTVYYHAQNALCRQMAADISRRVAEVSGIPCDGTRSDTIRFATGFGVLRGSPMPAVLVECGYVNSEDDLRKLQSDDVKQRIAEGIVAGLRDFLADRASVTAHVTR